LLLPEETRARVYWEIMTVQEKPPDSMQMLLKGTAKPLKITELHIEQMLGLPVRAKT